MKYYVYRVELTSYYHPEEGGYYQSGQEVVEIETCQTFKKALLKLRKWLKNEDLNQDANYFDGDAWVARDKQSYGVAGKYIGQGYMCGISRQEPKSIGWEPYC